MGGREWPLRPLLCIIVTLFPVWRFRRKKKKIQGGGSGEVGRRRARERSPGGDGGRQWLSLASSRPPRVPGARPRGKEMQLITSLRRLERLGQGSPHTRHPAVGQRLRPLGPPSHFSQRFQCLAFCLLCKIVRSFLCAHGERNALCFFLYLCPGRLSNPLLGYAQRRG